MTYLRALVARKDFLLATAWLAGTLTVFNVFARQVEFRSGVVLNDPLLNMFEAWDLNLIIFLVQYGCMISLIYAKRWEFGDLAHAFRAYGLMVLLRMTAMWLTPLDPPTGMITLQDPFLEFYFDGEPLTRDLFFSGHTATMFLFILFANKPWLKVMTISSFLIVAVGMALQKVHYSVDVFAAPFFTYCAVQLTRFR